MFNSFSNMPNTYAFENNTYAFNVYMIITNYALARNYGDDSDGLSLLLDQGCPDL